MEDSGSTWSSVRAAGLGMILDQSVGATYGESSLRSRLARRFYREHVQLPGMPEARKPARVLFAVPSMGPGGSERVLSTLLRHLDRSRFELHLALLKLPSGSEDHPKGFDVLLETLPPDVTVHSLGVSRARYATFSIARLCWRLRPSVVFSMSAYLTAAILGSRPLLPKDIWLLAREGANVMSRDVTTNWLRFTCYKHLYRLADFIVCQSDSMKRQFVRDFGLAPEKLARIYNPVDIDLIRIQADEEPNPFSGRGPHLLAVGRLFPEKGHDLLLKCMPRIRNAFSDATLTIVGAGPLHSLLEQQRVTLGLEGCVRLVGFKRNPYPFVKGADLLVLTSRYEALPNVVLEALALGKTVVTTNCSGSLQEIANTTAKLKIATGWTPESMADEIVRAINQLTSPPLSQDPDEKFVECFGLAKVISAYENLLKHHIEYAPPSTVDLINRSCTPN